MINSMPLRCCLLAMLVSQWVVSTCSAEETVMPLPFNSAYTFGQLGVSGALKLQGNQSLGYLSFGSRLDQLVNHAQLELNYTASPSLNGQESHLKVYFNNQLVSVVTLADTKMGTQQHVIIPLDARYFADFNQLKFELIGYTNAICQNPYNANIWLELAPDSRVMVDGQKLALANNLNLLPAPFFDHRDLTNLTMPLVTSAHPSLELIKQTGIVASYFSTLADWRESSFPLVEDQLPAGNAIVLMTNDQRPAFLSQLPPVDGAYLQVITHPTDKYSKLLLVMGRNDKELSQAILALTMSQPLLSGGLAKVESIEPLASRVPYDAPKWLDTTKPVTFASLVSKEYQLQSESHSRSPINVQFALPPDLFAWGSKGVPVKLLYRHSPVSKEQDSQLTVGVNDQFALGYKLTDDQSTTQSRTIRLPFFDELSAADATIPTVSRGTINKVSFDFTYSHSNNGECIGAQTNSYFSDINPESSIDFSEYPHYIEMPNINIFATTGFPFSRLADLSETAVIVPEQADSHTYQLYINWMAMLGKVTGYPGYNVTLTHDINQQEVQDKDIFAIELTPDQLLRLGGNQNQIVANVSDHRVDALLAKEQKLTAEKQSKKSVTGQQADVVLRENPQFATVNQFESGLSAKRTILAVNMANKADINLLSPLFLLKADASQFYGATAVVTPHLVASIEAKQHYFVGDLPILKFIWFHLSRYPLFITAGMIGFVFVLALITWRILKKIAHKRVTPSNS
jgi:cellulose synthase operon protein B